MARGKGARRNKRNWRLLRFNVLLNFLNRLASSFHLCKDGLRELKLHRMMSVRAGNAVRCVGLDRGHRPAVLFHFQALVLLRAHHGLTKHLGVLHLLFNLKVLFSHINLVFKALFVSSDGTDLTLGFRVPFFELDPQVVGVLKYVD